MRLPSQFSKIFFAFIPKRTCFFLFGLAFGACSVTEPVISTNPGISNIPAHQPRPSTNIADSVYSTSPGQHFSTSPLPEYVVHRTIGSIEIDGVLDEYDWKIAPRTRLFTDIRDVKSETPILETRAQIIWDDWFVYISATLQEPHVWATLTEKNSIIFHDNDFEVFLDPDGDNHHYHELEINALGTLWELTLEKPYRDGGPYRIPHNLDGLKTAVKVNGTINDPSDVDSGWTVEMAIPLRSFQSFSPELKTLSAGDVWRINFSRVQWPLHQGPDRYHKIEGEKEHNWVWSPIGIVDMHRPERWGIAVFSNESAEFPDMEAEIELAKYRKTLFARTWLMNTYYYAAHFNQVVGHFPENVDPVNQAMVSDPTFSYQPSETRINYQITENGYVASIMTLSIDHAGKLK